MRVNILMYHSISQAPGPTSIPPAVFREQMEVLAECGYQAISLSVLGTWLSGGAEPPPRSVVITFDDGFADFAEHAAPVLRRQGWTATVFLPSGKIGGHEDWRGALTNPPRTLMSWEQVAALARDGFEFGGHSVTHPDLATLSPEELTDEIRQSREQIAVRLGQVPTTFATPYGSSSPQVQREIEKWFRISVGTRLARATRQSDVHDLPRIEMHYFRNRERWRDYLEGRAEWYFACRRILRAAGERVRGPMATPRRGR